MKKIPMDPPHLGVLHFGTGASVMDAAVIARSPAQPLPEQTFDWQSAVQPSQFRPYRAFFKRAFDVVFVLATLPFSLPLIAICALALWIEDGSPFYAQDRLGRKGARFRIFKLRTMVRNADQVLEDYLAKDPEMRREWDDLQKIKNDPRVTRIGQFLRMTSLDELPQLLNVLTGDMSLVGPRPMLPEQEDMYGNMHHYNAVRPGITGLWQVSARNAKGFTYRNEVDGSYERALSLKLDLTILIKTVGVVLRPTGH